MRTLIYPRRSTTLAVRLHNAGQPRMAHVIDRAIEEAADDWNRREGYRLDPDVDSHFAVLELDILRLLEVDL